MIRLNNAAREDMVNALLIHSFKDRATQLNLKSNILFDLVHDDTYDAETIALMTKLLKRHKSAFEHCNKRTVNVAGYRIEIGQSRIGYGSVRFSVDRARRPVIKSIEEHIAYTDCDLADAIKTLSEVTKQLTDDMKQSSILLTATLGRFTSDKQLRDQWPEALPIIEKYIPRARGQLPAIPFAKINAEFGLPPKAEGGVA